MSRSVLGLLAAVGLTVASLAGCSSADPDAEGNTDDLPVMGITDHLPVMGITDHLPVMGITYPVWAVDGYDRTENTTHIEQIALTGAGWISFSITWYQDELDSSCPGPTERTVSLGGLERVTAIAIDAGMRVAVKPMVDLEDDSQYRGEIAPADLERWFECYSSLMNELSTMAQRVGIDLIVVGTELIELERHEDHWRSVVSGLRNRFEGLLTYSANYTDLETVEFWDALDLIGVSAYWPLSNHPTTDVELLTEGWAPHIAALEVMADRWSRPVLLAEIGYRSVEGSTTEPWNWNSSGPVSEAEQAAAFEATARAWSRSGSFGGALVWAWDDLAQADDDQRVDYTPRGKPAEDVLQRWFSTTLSD